MKPDWQVESLCVTSYCDVQIKTGMGAVNHNSTSQ